MQNKQALLSVSGIYKKFSKDIRYNMWYGLTDVVQQSLGRDMNYMQLRNKEFWALQDISFEVFPGDIISLMGANGSGKTTLLRIISQVYPLEVGNVQYNNIQRITPLFAVKSGLNSLYSGRENIYLKGAMLGMSRAEINDKLDFIIDFSGLSNFIETPLGSYSSGMRVRLAFSVALATDPDIFILDEALAFGDAIFKANAFQYLQNWITTGDKAIIITTHKVRDMIKLANRGILLDKGKLIQDSENISSMIDTYLKNYLYSKKGENDQEALQKLYDFLDVKLEDD